MTDLLENYKETMSHWPSGVAIVTSYLDGKTHGMTVSSFTSVSLTPPMVSICVDKRSAMNDFLKESLNFAVNILRIDQIELAKAFSNHQLSMSERFKKAQFKPSSKTQSPILEPSLGFLDCLIDSWHDTGDHVIYVGNVQESACSSEEIPLVYYRRGWHQVA